MKKLKFLLIIVLILEIGYFFYQETNDIVVNVQEIQDSALADVLSGLKVIQISDLHIKSVGIREKRLIQLINKIGPDIIFITGDFVSNNKGIKPYLKVLKQISDGRLVIAVLGNSDHSYKDKIMDTEQLAKEMKAIGIKILVNESLKLTVKTGNSALVHSVYVVGLDDNYLWFDDIFKAMNNVPEHSPKILLAHCPNIVEKIDTKGIDLILSGHTHGGQIALPFITSFAIYAPCNSKKNYVSGLYGEGDNYLYVNKGIGTSGKIPLRLFCKPEITLFKFKYQNI